MFERFTSRARSIMVLAQVESRALNHTYIGTEHILLGLVHEGEGVAAQALKSLDISLEAVRQQVQEIIGSGKQTRAPSGHIPFTPRAKKVLELSLREALQLGHNYIGTEHILLGLIREGEGVAAQVLARLGADHDRVRAQVIHLIVARESAGPAAGSVPRVGRLPGSLTIGSGRLAGSGRTVGSGRTAGSGRMPGSGRMTTAGEVSLLDALDAIGERLAAIEARLGISAQGSRSPAELERELARLMALLVRHGIDPEVGQTADLSTSPGGDPGVERAADPGADPGGDPGADPGGDPDAGPDAPPPAN